MDDDVIIFAGQELRCVDYTIISKINSMPLAEVFVSKTRFDEIGLVNYLDEAIIQNRNTGKRLYTGNIASIHEEDTKIRIKLETGVEYSEGVIAGLQVTGIQPQEMLYSIARMAGTPASKIIIDQLDESVKEMCAFIPIKGMKIIDKEEFGEYQLIDLSHIRDKVVTDEKTHIWNDFLDADGWLFFKLNAVHFAEAEEHALQMADKFLTLYSLILQYSYSKFNAQKVLWRRSIPQINLTRKDMILLVKPLGGSSWLHNTADYHPSSGKVIEPIDFSFNQIHKANQSAELVLQVWNKFRNSDDYHMIAVGLWQVAELISASNKLEKKYKKSLLRELRNKLDNTLEDNELMMIKPLLDNINQHTLTEKLDNTFEVIGVSLSQSDKDLLNKFRKIRNDIEHGRKSIEPSLQEISRTKALVGMMIVEFVNFEQQSPH